MTSAFLGTLEFYSVPRDADSPAVRTSDRGMPSEIGVSLFRPEGFDRAEAGGASCGQPTREERDPE
jgi:hypothetical protein